LVRSPWICPGSTGPGVNCSAAASDIAFC
jgi:hypothetical protein